MFPAWLDKLIRPPILPEIEIPHKPKYFSLEQSNEQYFILLNKINEYKKQKNYKKVLECCMASIPFLIDLVRYQYNEFGSFDIQSIPAVEIGLQYLGTLNYINEINIIRNVLNLSDNLRDGWMGCADLALKDAGLSISIQKYIFNNPGVLQKELGKKLGVSGHDTIRIITILDKFRFISRVQTDKSHALYLRSEKLIDTA